MPTRGRQGGSRTGTFLVLSGIVGVLSVTFVAGVWTGRNWPVIVGNPRSPAAADAETPKPRVAAERPRSAEPLPALTFYHDLKAPLTAPPPPPKAVKPPKPPEPKREDVARAEPAPPPRAETSLPESGQRYTVQVAAYNARPPAESMRATLAAAGHDARIVETDRGSGVHYRVHVGVFSTKEAAREAAARLAAERSMPTYVTTR
jgi:cell division protein FtsN